MARYAKGVGQAALLTDEVEKILGRGLERWTGSSDLPRPLVVFIGCAEVLGAAGLVLPMTPGVLPWLTPLAAVGLAISVLLAAGFHLRADERLSALETGLWASIAAVVAIGRWELIAARGEVPPWVLGAALGLLVPAAVLNVIVLWRRPVKSGPPRPVAEAVPAHSPRRLPTASAG